MLFCRTKKVKMENLEQKIFVIKSSKGKNVMEQEK